MVRILGFSGENSSAGCGGGGTREGGVGGVGVEGVRLNGGR